VVNSSNPIAGRYLKLARDRARISSSRVHQIPLWELAWKPSIAFDCLEFNALFVI
jgi:hypothetical protein